MALALLETGNYAKSEKSRPKRRTSYGQSIQIQEMLLRDALAEGTDSADRARVAHVWKELEELKLRLKMKPAPKAIDTTKLAKRTRKSADPAGPIEPGEPTK